MYIMAGNPIQVRRTTYTRTQQFMPASMMSIVCCTIKISLQLQHCYVAMLTATSQHCGYSVVSADWQRAFNAYTAFAVLDSYS